MIKKNLRHQCYNFIYKLKEMFSKKLKLLTTCGETGNNNQKSQPRHYYLHMYYIILCLDFMSFVMTNRRVNGRHQSNGHLGFSSFFFFTAFECLHHRLHNLSNTMCRTYGTYTHFTS